MTFSTPPNLPPPSPLLASHAARSVPVRQLFPANKEGHQQAHNEVLMLEDGQIDEMNVKKNPPDAAGGGGGH